MGCSRSKKSAWDFVRIKMSSFVWAKWIWSKWLPKKMSICKWKATFNFLSVDDQVRKLGISLASRCNCCLVGSVEDLEHVLGKGEFAVAIWRKASTEEGIPFLMQNTWRERVQLWFNRANRQS